MSRCFSRIAATTGDGSLRDLGSTRRQAASRSLVLPSLATTVGELWLDADEDDDDAADPGANGT